MGCDIHIVIQRQDEDGAWKELPWQRQAYDYVGAAPNVPDVPIAPEAFNNRNYNLFAILANVRNGVGFAGIKTGEGWPSIAPDRGLPEGFDEEATLPNPLYPEDGPRWIGDHSFTWVTLNELKAYDWHGVSTTLYGVVTAEAFEEMVPGEQPKGGWSGHITGPGIHIYTLPEYIVAKHMNTLVERPHVRTSWKRTAAEATGWPDDVLPWLEQLANGRPLRLVMGFDS